MNFINDSTDNFSTVENDLNRSMHLRFESLSKLSVEIAGTKDFGEAFSCLSLNLKYLMEAFGFLFYYQREEERHCFLGFPRNKSVIDDPKDPHFGLVESIIAEGHPKLYCGDEVQLPIFENTHFQNPRIISILAYPLELGDNGNALLIVSNKNTSNYYQFDFKFSRLIIHAVCNKLDQIHAQNSLLNLIDEKEALLQDLRYEQDLSQKTLAALAEGLILTDHRGRVSKVNSALTHLIGLSPEAIIGKDIETLFSTPGQIPSGTQSIQYLKDHGSLRGLETALLDVKGKEIPVLFSGAALWDNQDKVSGMVAIVSDLSVSKKMEVEQRERATAEAVAQTERERAEELKKVNEELDRFVHVASHDLKAPLTSIMGLAEMSSSPNVTPEQQVNIMGMIRKSVAKLDHFIQDIVDYSRNARTDVKLTPVNLEEEAQSIIEGLSFMEGAHQIDFQVSVNTTTPFISDATRIRIILNNFLSNAVKYHDFSKEKPFVRFHANVKAEQVTVTVQDNGKGIAEKHHKKLFEMFYRATSSKQGSGIGLYIVQEMASKLGANIAFTSEVNQGSTFTITIPNQPPVE